ncbi:MAG: DNA replication and repair protein RecF [Bacteroidales bacterium]
MILENLSLLNFKNICGADISFSRNINCFLGNNGMGKTNLMDAVYYLSFCKSSSNIPDSQIIRHGEQMLMLRGSYLNIGNDERTEIQCGVKLHQRKVFKRDRKEYDRLSEHIGFIPLVLVSPEDNELVREGSDIRRRFTDQTLSQFDREYLVAIMAYNKALASRNAMLRREESEDALYDILEEQMTSLASIIHKRREDFIKDFVPVFNNFYSGVSGGNENVSLFYKSHLNEGELLPQLRDARKRDIAVGYSTRGIHKDDLDMVMDGFPVKRFGSQGQQRSFSIALRFAQFDFLKSKGGKTPILLLDDIFDKLDAGRVERIMEIVSGTGFGQIFVTDTNRKYLDGIVRKTGGDYKLFSVNNGDIKEI